MTDPLVWLPFPPADLGDPPGGLRYELVRPDRGELPESAAEVELFVPAYQLGPMPPDLFARMPRLRVVQTMTAGVDHLRASVPAGVLLCNGRGIHDTATAEQALTLVLASLNRLQEFGHAQDRGTWEPRWRRGLADRNVLIVGHGQIGSAIERRLLPFECEVTRVARSARPGVHAVADLPDLLPSADVVVLILPGTAQTRGLFDAAMLARMKDGALLVNVARGNVVVSADLCAELESGRLYAAVDVTDPEPLPADDPLWKAPQLLITPHVGGASAAMWPRAHRLVREQLARYAAGEPLVNQMTGDY
ncbi:2-hydroxyacid dehydrogenase [Nocardioides terrisoli]|uniref:2-hydroxyacid dehydrogenase n=1 Tax=Nocardioides terrisoli TaxID=3388267 RepID=UPI00287B89CD|nr:2-hydroxyacid dehydrogenase [Nocardioides marmorisolisilvae]